MTFTTIDQSLIPSSQVNILDNAGFEIWQRGNSFTSTSSSPVYTADRWFSNGNAGQSIAITQESSVIDSGLYSLKVVATNANSNSFNMVQTVENKQIYYNKTMSLSIRVKTSVANVIQIGFVIGNGIYAWSNFHSGSGNWETLTVTGTIASSLSVPLNIYVGATTVAIPNGTIYYADSATFVYGTNSAPFVPLNVAIDLLRCQRFYQFGGGSNELKYYNMTRDASHNYFYYTGQFFTPMRAAPTMVVTAIQIILVQDAIQGTATLGADQANWTMINDGVDTQVFNYQGSRNTANATYSNVQAQVSWTASADL